MIILGIETSCDETALALIESKEEGGEMRYRIIHSLVHSQAELHSAYGGVYPSLAKREHGKNLVPLLEKLLIESEIGKVPSKTPFSHFNETVEKFRTELEPQNPDLFQSFANANFLQNEHRPKIDRISVTEGPGLEPALWVGINFARMLGELWNIPVIPANHMEGHVLGSLIESDAVKGGWQKLKPVQFPALALLISGGHTELVKIDEGFKYKIIGQTKDDAVGEAFDKAARLLGLPYPGGPHISLYSKKAFEEGIVSEVRLPRPMIGSGNLDFSFSGLKTAVLYAVRKAADSKGNLDEMWKKGLAREFEEAVTETLDSKLRAAIEFSGANTLIIGGGVSANSALRSRFEKTANEYGIPIYLPSRHVSGDNALMIALAGAVAKAPSEPIQIKAQGTKRLA